MLFIPRIYGEYCKVWHRQSDSKTIATAVSSRNKNSIPGNGSNPLRYPQLTKSFKLNLFQRQKCPSNRHYSNAIQCNDQLMTLRLLRCMENMAGKCSAEYQNKIIRSSWRPSLSRFSSPFSTLPREVILYGKHNQTSEQVHRKQRQELVYHHQ